MNWDDIRWFYEIKKHGSFSAAARTNDITQATLSRRIQKLEKVLGKALFIRGREGSDLTPTGYALSDAAAQMHGAYQDFENTFQQLSQGSSKIVLTCGNLIAMFLSQHIGALQRDLEGVEVEINGTNDFVDIEKGDADVALRDKRPAKGQLIAKRLRADGYGPFSAFASDKFFSKNDVYNLDILRAYDWISYTRSNANAPTAHWVINHIGEAAIKYRMSNALNILEALKSHKAVALLPRFIGRGTDGLIEIYGPVDDLTLEMWAVRRESSRNDIRLNTLLDNIEALFVSLSA